RSSVGRYFKNANETMRRVREAREIATVWIDKVQNEPEGDIGRLAIELIRTAAFQQLASMGEGEVVADDAMRVMLLAKALDHASRSAKVDLDTLVKARREFAAKAAEAVEEEGKKAGISDDLVETIKRR